MWLATFSRKFFSDTSTVMTVPFFGQDGLAE
jgi:hypothetical protein